MQWPQWISDVGRPIIKIDRFLSARISSDPRLSFPRPPLVDGIMHALGSDSGVWIIIETIDRPLWWLKGSMPWGRTYSLDPGSNHVHQGPPRKRRTLYYSSPSGFWSMHHMPISHWASTWTKYRSRRGERLSFIKRQHMAGPTGEEPPSYSYMSFFRCYLARGHTARTGMKTDQKRTDITDIIFVFIFMFRFKHE